MIKVACAICKKEIEGQACLFFGEPIYKRPLKEHICLQCAALRIYPMFRQKWDDTFLQAVRLVAEMIATFKHPTKEELKELCASMDLSVRDVEMLMDRIQLEWERHKETLR